MTAATLDGRVFEPPPVRPLWLRPVVIAIVIALHAAALSIVYLEPKPVELPREVVVDIRAGSAARGSPGAAGRTAEAARTICGRRRLKTAAPAARRPPPPVPAAPPVVEPPPPPAGGATSAPAAGEPPPPVAEQPPPPPPRRSLRFPRREPPAAVPLRSSLRRRLRLRSRSSPRRPSLRRPRVEAAETRGASPREASAEPQTPREPERSPAPLAQGAARRSLRASPRPQAPRRFRPI